MSLPPQPTEHGRPQLSDLLEARQEELVHRWTERLRAGHPPGQWTRAELADSIHEYLRQLIAVLRRNEDETDDPVVPRRSPVTREHGRQRQHLGFDIRSLVREYHVLRECILDLVEEQGGHLSPREVRILSAFITTSVTEGMDEYSRQHDAVGRLNEEQELREREERFRLLVEGMEDYSIIMLDLEGRVASWNTGAERITGWRPEEILGQHLSSFYTPEDVAEGAPERCLQTATREGHCRAEGLRLRKDGRRFWAEVILSALRDEGGHLRGFAKVTRDISRRKRAEQAQALFVEAGTLLSQSLDVATTLSRFTRLAVENLADYCMVDLLEEDGQLHRVEVAAREPELRPIIERTRPYPPRMGSRSPVSLALERGEAVVVPEVTPAWLDAAARNEEHRALLEQLSAKSVVLVPLVARGRKLGIINLAWTRPRGARSEVDLEVARGLADRAAVAIDNARLYQEAHEAIRVREDVVAIVSHDLRNPLNAISLSATTLLKREDVDERTTKAASRIYAASDRATKMIRDLLDFTQARVGGIPIHRKPLDFHEHVHRVLEEMRLAWPERTLDFHASGDGRGAWDEGRLAQVVTNLVGNALQHSPPGTPVRVTSRGEDGHVLLEVHNEGGPIPIELLPTLFEPYQRGPEPGVGRGSLGLGLFIARQIVLGHGGTLDVRSSIGEGTTFTVRLPRGT